MDEKLYGVKPLSYAVDKSGYNHLVDILAGWIKWTIWDYIKEKDNEDKANEFLENSSKDKVDWKPLTENFFEKFYNKNGKNQYPEALRFWDENECKGFREKNNTEKNDKKDKCSYCELSGEVLEKFYHKVDSYRWQRGRDFEIDRQKGRLKVYPEKQHDDFIAYCKNRFSQNEHEFKKAISKDIFDLLKSALESKDADEYYLDLPASYNEDNCVFACTWCNNAKTDAFNESQFKEIGLKIGEAIRDMLKDDIIIVYDENKKRWEIKH